MAQGINRKNSERDAILLLIFLNLFGLPGNYGLVIGQIVNTLFDYLAFLLEIYLMVQYTRRWSDLFINRSMFLFWTIIAGVSLYVTPFKGDEMVTCVRFLVTILFSQWILLNYSSEKLVKIAFQAQTMIVISIALYILVAPVSAFRGPQNTMIALRGIFHSKNGCGGEMSFGLIISYLFYLFHPAMKKKEKHRVMAVIGVEVLFLLLSKSTGPLMVTAISLFYLYRYSRKRFSLSSVFILGSSGFILFALVFIQVMAPLLAAIGKTVTLTGRTDIWRQVIVVMTSTHTWTGFGFGMFWRDESAYSLFHAGFDPFSWAANMTAGAHNTIFEMWLNVGLIGIIAFMYVFAACLKGSSRYLNRNEWKLASVYIIYFTVFGFTERGLMVYDYRTLFLFICLGMTAVKVKKMKALRRKQLKRLKSEQNRNLHSDIQEGGTS